MPHPLRRTLVSCAVLSAVAVPISGCTSSDTKKANAYVSEVNGIQADVASQVTQATLKISPSSAPAADRAALESFDTAITRGVVRLKAVKPPSKVAALHAKLITTIDGFRTAIATAKAKLGTLTSGKPATLIAAQGAFITSLNAVSAGITSTIDDINRKLHS